jgi:hypothetical protein
VILTESDVLVPLPTAPVQYWLFDPGFRGEAFAWRHHLQVAGLDPGINRILYTTKLVWAVGNEQHVPGRDASLWLASNLPTLQGSPCRLELSRGILFRDDPKLPDPERNRPLLGLRLFRQARLKVELDFDHGTISVWTPDGVTPGP